VPDPTDSTTVVVLVPAGVAIAIATVIGYWVRKRAVEKKKPPPPPS